MNPMGMHACDRCIMNNLAPYDGEIYLIERFFAPEQADVYWEDLQTSLAWQSETIRIAGRPVTVPRLMCWYGDSDSVYAYSGVAHQPLPWTDALRDIKRAIENASGWTFNSVLGNLYRDQNDSLGWHADDEPELGHNPRIASLSFGAERLFKLRHRKSGEGIELRLTHGSLLLMEGRLQHCWRHCVPKTRRVKAARINLTFRRIQPAAR